MKTNRLSYYIDQTPWFTSRWRSLPPKMPGWP
jgi:hypothetical protein